MLVSWIDAVLHCIGFSPFIVTLFYWSTNKTRTTKRASVPPWYNWNIAHLCAGDGVARNQCTKSQVSANISVARILARRYSRQWKREWQNDARLLKWKKFHNIFQVHNCWSRLIFQRYCQPQCDNVRLEYIPEGIKSIDFKTIQYCMAPFTCLAKLPRHSISRAFRFSPTILDYSRFSTTFIVINLFSNASHSKFNCCWRAQNNRS